LATVTVAGAYTAHASTEVIDGRESVVFSGTAHGLGTYLSVVGPSTSAPPRPCLSRWTTFVLSGGFRGSDDLTAASMTWLSGYAAGVYQSVTSTLTVTGL